MADAKHFIPTRHRAAWKPDDRHRGVDYCNVAGCGVLAMHAHTYDWRRSLTAFLSRRHGNVCRICGEKKRGLNDLPR